MKKELVKKKEMVKKDGEAAENEALECAALQTVEELEKDPILEAIQRKRVRALRLKMSYDSTCIELRKRFLATCPPRKLAIDENDPKRSRSDFGRWVLMTKVDCSKWVSRKKRNLSSPQPFRVDEVLHKFNLDLAEELSDISFGVEQKGCHCHAPTAVGKAYERKKNGVLWVKVVVNMMVQLF
ncbi:hypothetical protein OROHE_010488 [Orobanche hederae]